MALSDRHASSRSGFWRRSLGSDDGIAAVTVVATGSILFILATMLITLAVYNSDQTKHQEARLKALHMADAGLNAYLYQLRFQGRTYAATNPTMGWQNLDDGSWYVAATPSTSTSDVQLRATGIIPGEPATRTVVANVTFPTFAQFMFLSDADINIGADAVIGGRVRSNKNIDNQGIVKGLLEVTGNLTGKTGPGNLQGTGGPAAHPGYSTGVPTIDFNQVSADMTTMRTLAQSAGTYFGPLSSPYLGYRVTFNGSTATIERVKAVSGTGVLTVDTPVTRSIPGNGQFYFDDDIWVRGTYTGSATIGSNSNIYIPENLGPTGGLTSTYTMGLVAQNNVIVPSWYASVPQNMTVTAAMLAQTGTIYGDLQNGITKQKITITGSMSYRTYGYFAQYNGNTVTAGFQAREYDYDDRLTRFTPPNYPMIRTGALGVDSWVEQ